MATYFWQWHNGAIQEDEIWLKLGGDIGGGTFKMAFQHLNIPCPNAPENTCVFTIFKALDTYTNLHIGLNHHVDEIKELESKTWRYSQYLYIMLQRLTQ